MLNKPEQLDAEWTFDWPLVQSLCLQRGWDMGQLARTAGISRTTLHHLQVKKIEKPRLSTLHKLAEALQVDPRQLISGAEREDTAASLTAGLGPAGKPEQTCPRAVLFTTQGQAALFDRQTNWCVEEVCRQSPELFRDWTDEEWEELFSSFGVGGELNEAGVRQQAIAINQRRDTFYELHVILETHLADAARRIIHSLYESIQCPDTVSREPGTRS